MKKIIIYLMALCTFDAYAANENAATSKEYVDTELATKQPTIPAQGNNVVMTFDSTATDGIGEKAIYDESTAYDTQQNALVTAATANAAVQMAINGEFICTEYSNIDPTDCWLWGIKSEYYAKYDLIGSRRNSGLFSRNSGADGTFDSNTKIATILMDSGRDSGNVGFGLYKSLQNYFSEHKYYWTAKMKTTVPEVINCQILRDTMSTTTFTVKNEWGTYGVIFQAQFDDNDNQNHYPVLHCLYPGGNQGVMVDQNEYSIYDLTEIFGAGNEPATADAAAKALGLLYMP